MKEAEMEAIGAFISEAINAKGDDTKLETIAHKVKDLTDRFPLYEGLTYV